MTKFVRVKRRNVGGSTVKVKGIRFKFTKAKATGKVHIILSMGEEIQKHLKIVPKDKLILGYGEENPYEMQLLKAHPEDFDGFTVSNPSGSAVSAAFPWDASIVPDEVLAQRSQEAVFDLQPDCVIFNAVLRFNEKIH